MTKEEYWWNVLQIRLGTIDTHCYGMRQDLANLPLRPDTRENNTRRDTLEQSLLDAHRYRHDICTAWAGHSMSEPVKQRRRLGGAARRRAAKRKSNKLVKP